MAEDETITAVPDLSLKDDEFILRQSGVSQDKKNAAVEKLRKGIQDNAMTPYLKQLIADDTIQKQLHGTEAQVEELEKKNLETVKELENKLEEARKNKADEGDIVKGFAQHYVRIGELEKALSSSEELFEKSVGAGQRIDVQLMMIRVGYFHWNPSVVRKHLEIAQELVEAGGDWDRRNRLRAYEGLMLVWERKFSQATPMLLDALPTFAATELMSYDRYVQICTICGLLELQRKDLKKKILDSPDVLAILPSSCPELMALVRSLYAGDYRSYIQNLAAIEESLLTLDPVLSLHRQYLVRRLRVKAYNQCLESYRSVTLENLAEAFGLLPSYLDDDLCKFIASGSVHCTIDRVHGIVETRRADLQNQKFSELLRSGDTLLTSIQTLSKVIS